MYILNKIKYVYYFFPLENPVGNKYKYILHLIVCFFLIGYHVSKRFYIFYILECTDILFVKSL